MENYSGNHFIHHAKKMIKPILILILLAIPLVSVSILRKKDTYGEYYRNWSAGERFAHISVLLSEHSEFSIENIYRFRSELTTNLEMDDALKSKNDTVTWIDCYSAKGEAQVDTGASSQPVTTYGVGGEFFRMHPFRLLRGSFFSDENVMDDLIMIDEDLAWQLFGSSDIIGMTVWLNEKPFIVSGVIRRESGMFNASSGNKETAIYMSYSAFEKFNTVPITNYEIVMPNLTKGYAYKIVKKNIGAQEPFEIVQVSDRMSYSNLLKTIKDFGKSVMHTKPIAYPYWENKSRALLNVCAVVFLFFLIEFILVTVYTIAKCILYYKNNEKQIFAKIDYCKMTVSHLFRNIKLKIFGKKVNTVILDLGMVLVDFIPKEHMKNVGIKEGKIKAVMEAVVDNEIWDEYDRGIMTYEETLGKMIEKSPKLEKEIRKVFGNLEGIVKKFDYTDRLIKELKNAGYRVLYLSNLSQKLYQDCEKELAFINALDGGILSFEVKMKKPDQEIYELMIRKYHLTPEQCVFFDDREVNLRAAQELGMGTVIFNRDDLIKSKQDGYDYHVLLEKIKN
ncbi:MAG: HAD-IA family hydrolase [Lachnospiraceae bacterium]|nr:HAD-IA family hydrolase [Lachnospiraceae bacterium]